MIQEKEKASSLEVPLHNLSRKLREHRRVRGLSLNALGQDIGIDRRKLSQLEGLLDEPPAEPPTLTLQELCDIDRYFKECGAEGVSSIFQAGSILEQIAADQHDVTFILGSRPDGADRRIDVSRWDVRSFQSLLSGLNQTGQPFTFNLEDVIWREHASKSLSKRVSRDETWFHQLEERKSSFVSIGSPLACHASEVCLARMLGVEAFQAWPNLSPPPFSFGWALNDGKTQGLESVLDAARQPHSQHRETIDWLKSNPDHLALFTDKQAFRVVRKQKTKWTSYGIIAAQRREADDSIWIVCGGLTGPATMASATVASRFNPEPAKLNYPNVAWALVTCTVAGDKTGHYRKDVRRIVNTQVSAPFYWSP